MFKRIKALFFPPQVKINGQKILVIEDNPVDQKIAVAAIKRGGYVALVASTGQEGFAIAQKENPDLIILDYMLPDTKGPDLCVQIKADEQTKHIPVLFLTSLDTPQGVVACFDTGGDNYLSKPISSNVLLNYIEELIKENRHD